MAADRTRPIALALIALCLAGTAAAQSRPRARELGIPLEGSTGFFDAITDVPGVEVGHTTLIAGSGALQRGKGPVRTGVTVVFPRGKHAADGVMAAWFTLNGNGEMTGTTWVEESGFLWGPVTITNSLSVGVARDAVIEWGVQHGMSPWLWGLPVVAETWDGGLNDIAGFHVTKRDVFRALDQAASGPVPEGNVGGGTGMRCHEFKGGIGTASRVLPSEAGGYRVGVLVQCNYGVRSRLRVAGVPVGQEIPDLFPCRASSAPLSPDSDDDVRAAPPCTGGATGTAPPSRAERGSIIIVLGTDAPLLPHQLKRIAKRASLGVGRMGGLGGNSSGDIFIAFSTANPGAAGDTGTAALTMLSNDRINPLFEATVQATEEAILNAMLGAETMTGADGYRLYALPTDRLLAAMRKYGRMR